MTVKSKILVFIPTFNDTEFLQEMTKVVSSLPGKFVPLVVDDGSTQAVDQTMVAPGTLLTRLPTNFGLGTATHIAFDHAIRHGYDIVARLDSDGQHPIDSLPDLIEPLLESEVDMTIGLRVNRDEGRGFRSLLAKSIRWYLTKVSRLVSGGKTPHDMNTGFFAVTVDAARKLNSLNLERYPEPQIFLSAHILDITTSECEIRQRDREFGQSSINFFQALMLLSRFHILLLALLLQAKAEK
jgi:glycosyltransferase involved in cell wall biosynthesis